MATIGTPGTSASTTTGPVLRASGSPSGAAVSTVVPSNLKTSGWYLTAAIGAGILLGNTPVAPLVFGILTLGLIYQFSLLLEGK